ncbi:lipopolysaccharide assembly protein LapB [uncultured Selenomonas sp.]|uniref:tetratricopeptide repeat protein n=1 Tax=uncultured Selenomonas sp. TaxID=159275 RepID=UPI0025E0A25B|nr:CDC27 family protein [uncultured Selenomonas sp.]MDY6269138.1 CDC27 family protein [Selenomonadaceae bacterium]
MGKASRRYNREKNRKQEAQQTKQQEQEKRTLGARMMEHIGREEYADALNVLAELIEKKIYDPQYMYEGADCYFKIGDYQRATQWLTNTLQFAPDHVAARLLLARICILEDRVDDGLAVYDFVLEHYAQAIQPEQREDMEDILEYYVQEDPERIAHAFPYVAQFMHIESAKTVDVAAAETPQAPVVKVASDETPSMELKVSMNPSPKSVDVSVDTAAPTKVDTPDAAADMAEAKAKLQDVLAMDTSIGERIHLLNVFAGGYFVTNAIAAAQSFLAAALKLDAHDDETLRNLAVVTKAQGDANKALQFAAAMRTTDFVLLQLLKG